MVHTVNPLKPTCFNTDYFCLLPTECSYGFRTVLRINTDNFLNRINRLVSVAETQFISCEIRDEFVYIVTWRMKAGIAHSEKTSITKQRHGKHVSAVTNNHATKEELLEAVVSIRSVPRLYGWES
jgi:hypothetical protein